MARLKQIGIDIDVHRAIENSRLSFSETENDVLRRLLLVSTGPGKGKPAKVSQQRIVRNRGRWEVRILGATLQATSLLGAYEVFLRTLAGRSDDFLKDFSLKKGRSRLYVARKPDALYLSAPHLAKDHAKELLEGWWFDTNLSEQQVAVRIRAAAECAGLKYGTDALILENDRKI